MTGVSWIIRERCYRDKMGTGTENIFILASSCAGLKSIFHEVLFKESCMTLTALPRIESDCSLAWQGLGVTAILCGLPQCHVLATRESRDRQRDVDVLHRPCYSHLHPAWIQATGCTDTFNFLQFPTRNRNFFGTSGTFRNFFSF